MYIRVPLYIKKYITIIPITELESLDFECNNNTQNIVLETPGLNFKFLLTQLNSVVNLLLKKDANILYVGVISPFVYLI